MIGVKSPESLRTVREVTTLSGQSLSINLEVQLTAPNYEEPNQEVVESPLVFTKRVLVDPNHRQTTFLDITVIGQMML